MPSQPNSLPQAQHLRRESSQSAHSDMGNANMGRGGYPQNGGRGGRGGYPAQHQHYNPNMANHSPQPAYRPLPHQQMGRGMPPAFQPQGMQPQVGSPYRQTRSPAITPATMHQQAHLANPQGMQFYPGQQYQQPVRIPFSTTTYIALRVNLVLPTASHVPSPLFLRSFACWQFHFFSHHIA